MERRCFIALGAALAASPALVAAKKVPGHVPFSNAAYKEALASGKPLLLDFYASW